MYPVILNTLFCRVHTENNQVESDFHLEKLVLPWKQNLISLELAEYLPFLYTTDVHIFLILCDKLI